MSIYDPKFHVCRYLYAGLQQCRALAPVLSSRDRSRFLLGTCDIRRDNEVLLMAYHVA